MWVAVALVAFCCLGIVGLGGLGVSMFGTGMKTAGCMMNFSFARASIKAYVKKNGVYPPARTWQTDTEEYYKKIYDKMNSKKSDEKVTEWMKFAKPGQTFECSWGDTTTGIAYNQELEGKKPEEIKDPAKTVMLFETPESKANNHAVYAKDTTHKPPKIFGQERDWFNFYINGQSEMFKNSRGKTQINDSDFDIDLDEESGDVTIGGKQVGKSSGAAGAKTPEKAPPAQEKL